MLGIFDLQKHQTLKNIQVFYDTTIHSVAFSCDNKSAFISNWDGNIKILKWETGAKSGDDFYFTQKSKQVGNNYTLTICLTKDEKYLLVGSHLLVSVFKTATREITKEFKMSTSVSKITLIKDEKKALIVEENGNLSILNLETLKISLIAKNITKNNYLLTIA